MPFILGHRVPDESGGFDDLQDRAHCRTRDSTLFPDRIWFNEIDQKNISGTCVLQGLEVLMHQVLFAALIKKGLVIEELRIEQALELCIPA